MNTLKISCEVLPRLELGLPDSESEVLTNYTIEPMQLAQCMVVVKVNQIIRLAFIFDIVLLGTCSVVVITAVSHTAGPQFEPGQVQIITYFKYMKLKIILKNMIVNR